jgi:polyisoprenyl-teichoic acid--peptidoglycan teichoic acid transferase
VECEIKMVSIDNRYQQADSNAPTQPVPVPPYQPLQQPSNAYPLNDPDPLSHYQPIRIQRPPLRRRSRFSCGCTGISLLVIVLVLVVGAAAYLLAPGQTRILILGVDRASDGSYTSRTDTIMLMQVNPLGPDVKMLSIPRDLWVPIAGVGENRINTAHFFAEAAQKGSGPQAAIAVVETNFGVKIPYYARVRFDGFKEVVDAMGGIDLTLDKPMGGLDAGAHHLDGAQALAFARDRKGTDDFFRMNQGQFVLLAGARQLLNPLTWPRIPFVYTTFLSVVDTNLPFWEWPRIGLALLRAGFSGADHRTLTREMVQPFVTDGGAQVLLPRWELIRPLVQEMFGR